MRPVIVLWNDAYSEDEWISLDNYALKPEIPNISIGYIVRYYNGYVHVAATIDQDGNCCSIMAIPYDMIVYVAPLQIVNEAMMYGEKEVVEQYLQGKFAQRPEVYEFNKPAETVLETNPEPSVLNPPIVGSIQYVANPHQAPHE